MPQMKRGNQYAIWTICRNCNARSSFFSLRPGGTRWSNLADRPAPGEWEALDKGGPLRFHRARVAQAAPEEVSPGSTRLTWGKHKGKTYQEVLALDPGYAKWVCDQLKSETASNSLKDFGYYLMTQPGIHRGERPTMQKVETADETKARLEQLTQEVLQLRGLLSDAMGDKIERAPDGEELGDADGAAPSPVPITPVALLQNALEELLRQPAANGETQRLAMDLMHHVVGPGPDIQIQPTFEGAEQWHEIQ